MTELTRRAAADPADPSGNLALSSTDSPPTTQDDVKRQIAGSAAGGAGEAPTAACFAFARELTGIMPRAQADALPAIVRDWHEQALPFIRTKDFDESWTDFVTAWQRVERPAGQSLRVAVDRALR